MRRKLAIFAALGGFAGAALAQSSVTLFGLVDLNYQYLKSGSRSSVAGGHLTRLSDGATYGPGSRWGIRTTEDLGGGLRASGVLEAGFSADTGAVGNGGRAFGRQAFVALASESAGELRLGRQYSLHDEVMGQTNPFGNTTLLNPGAGSNTLTTGTVPLFIDATRIDNVLQYLSPVFNGVRLQASYAPGEELVDTYHGIKASYARGPVNLAASYEWSRARVATAGVSASGDTVNRILELGGNYDFRSFKVFGGYQRGKDLTPGPSGIVTSAQANGGIGTQIGSLSIPGLTGPATQLKAYTVGMSAPLGALTVATNYTLARFENSLGASRTLGRAGVAGVYSFSKTTMAYAAVAVHTGDLRDYINEKTIFQLGLRKAF